jgi:glycosyltransferase involved in cell wall biosynthesis
LEDLKDKGVPENKISIIPNGVDKEFFLEVMPDEEFKRRYDLEGKISCAYIGTIGMASGLEIVLDAAERLRQQKRTDIKFFLIGDGAERESLQADAEKRGLDNLIFTGMVPKTQVPGVLAVMDICLVHLKKKPLFTRVLPSKIFEMAAMGKPIILGVEGFAAELVREADCGVCIEPENVSEFLSALENLSSSSVARKRLGENGHRYVTEHYDRKVLSEQYVTILSQLVKMV